MISVALCTDNGERYIRQQLVSILEQRLSPDEIIICDDRSTDHILDIINDTMSVSKIPCHIYKNEVNFGYKRNFEKAIRNKLQIILKDHIENLQSRVDLFADLEKRLSLQKRSLIVPYSMHDFFRKD